MIQRFWVGTAEQGHFAIITQSTNVPLGAPEIPYNKAWLWQYAEAWNTIYAFWKVTGNTEAHTRLKSEWTWVKSHWSLSDVRICGNVPGQSATTQDDSSWAAMGLLELYEASRDPLALAYAQASIDCAYNRWYDGTTGGGLWYEDGHSDVFGKSVSNGNFALAMVMYYQHTCSLGACATKYLTNAIAIERWAAQTLRREDGLYWMYVIGSGRNPDALHPYDIGQAGSVVALFGNMGFAALQARLYGLTGDEVYLTRLRKTTEGILKYEVVNGIFLDDRDARGNGFAAWNFYNDVVPRLTDQRASTLAVFRATGFSVANYDRAADGSYGGDWSGPVNGVWDAHGFHSNRLEISANAAIWPLLLTH